MERQELLDELFASIPEFIDRNFPKNDTAADGGPATPGRGEATVLLSRFLLEAGDAPLAPASSCPL